MDRERRIEQHTWAANSPEAWKACACSLLAAGTVLRERRARGNRSSAGRPNQWEIHPVELMLNGMAIECLLKALWVKRGHNLAKDGKYKRVPRAGAHDLVQLAGVLELTLSTLEKDVLRRLSHFIEYGGRYPVPKDAEKLQLTRTPSGGRASATTWATPSDQVLLEAIVGRLRGLLDEDLG